MLTCGGVLCRSSALGIAFLYGAWQMSVVLLGVLPLIGELSLYT